MSDNCREIRIVTGPGGTVMGSKVYLDGEELKDLFYVEIKGEIGCNWELGTTRLLRSPERGSQGLGDEYLDLGEGKQDV